ncbi:MAG: glucose-1-phosphate adenylyltransferase subunit GlgD [Clostridia bacterium]|nr:glucose-1-phosphate adenylyltransferase subunit GlgD [Clostridia bacterium]
MMNGKVSGIIFTNSNDSALKEFTSFRSMASLPFGGRYRLIDFTISNFVNAGISNVGVITNQNYSSLLDHLGSGIYWDLDRKNGGLSILPPFISGSKNNVGELDAADRAVEYINRNNSEYVVVCESGTVANIDVKAVLNYHIEKNADITFLYRTSEKTDKFDRTLKLKLDDDGKVIKISDTKQSDEGGKLTMGFSIFTRAAFSELVNMASKVNTKDTFVSVMTKKFSAYNIFGYEHTGFVGVMDSRKAYFETSMELLNGDIREQLFNRKRPVYTKTKDDMPTRYGTHSSVKNSIIADGCIIDGTVKNSILFRGVRVRKGAVVENSILMQGVEIRENTKIKYVASDKNAVIGGKDPIKGTNRKAFIVKKNQTLID